jgi:predicted transcriptional regulator
LENAVLGVLWAAQAPLTPAQAQRGLVEQGYDLAYTSVATTLTRLHAKGLVERTATGRTYAYAPNGQAARNVADRMRALLGGGRARAVVLSHFVAGLDPDDEATLLELLARADAPPPHADGTRADGTRADAPDADAPDADAPTAATTPPAKRPRGKRPPAPDEGGRR